jgi:hypothetical protein
VIRRIIPEKEHVVEGHLAEAVTAFAVCLGKLGWDTSAVLGRMNERYQENDGLWVILADLAPAELQEVAELDVVERGREERRAIHDAGHGTYHPGPCEERVTLGWSDIA